MRIGIFGGTFNPVHNGHLALCKESKQRLKLEKIIFVPAYIPPHKDSKGIIDAEERYQMLELAIGQEEGFEISRYEIDRKEKVYSINTIAHFKALYSDSAELFFLTGSDSLKGLKSWKDIDKLLKLCRFAVFSRPGFEEDVAPSFVERIDMKPSWQRTH